MFDQALLVLQILISPKTQEKCSALLLHLTSQQFESSLRSRRTNPVLSIQSRHGSSRNLRSSLLHLSLQSSTDLSKLVTLVSFRAAVITPILKKSTLDPANVSSYRPISIQPIVAKYPFWVFYYFAQSWVFLGILFLISKYPFKIPK